MFQPHPAMEKAWRYLWERLFSESTNLFYDHTVSRENAGCTATLPTPDMIRADCPNPCGYGTGMEDSVLNGSMMLDAVLSRYRVTGEESMKPLADKLFDGLRKCASLPDAPGFIARSLSPFDGVSYYSNSSRDQYTHFVYSAYHFYTSALASEAQKQAIREILAAAAIRMETEVIPENDYELLRADGKHGIVQKMWGKLGEHEYLRLPMIYMAAYKTTGDGHFREMYLKYRDEGLQKSLPVDYVKLGMGYPAMQMQYSLRFLYDTDGDPAFREGCRRLMERAAKVNTPAMLANAAKLSENPDRPEFYYVYRDWRNIHARFTDFVGGKAYYNPGQAHFPENYHYPIRNVGDGAMIGTLAGDASAQIKNALISLASALDYDRHYSSAPLNLVGAYWSLAENENNC